MGDFLWRAEPWARTLVLHNWPIMIYSVLIVGAAIRAYLQPTRSAVLALYGFTVLAVAFEYDKHGVGVIRATTDYLFEVNPEAHFASRLFLVDILPILAYLSALAMLILSVAYARRGHPKGTPSRASNGGQP